MLRGAYNQSSAYIHRCWYSSSISKEINQILKQMSKLPGHDAILRREQSKLKRKAQKQHPPGKISIQVLGTGARGGPASIYLFTDQTRSVTDMIHIEFRYFESNFIIFLIRLIVVGI